MSKPYTAEHEERLQQARQEYHALASGPAASFAVSAAFDHPGFCIADYCRDFGPNPAAAEAEADIRRYAERFDIWIPGATEHCNSLASYLYPGAGLTQLVAIGKNFAISWYLNDTIGRERVAAFDSRGRQILQKARQRFADISRTLKSTPDASPVDFANLEMLWEVRSQSPEDWFASFQELWARDVETMCRDWNARAEGVFPTPEEYVEARTYISGMQHTIAFGEFAENRFLAWPELEQLKLAAPLRRVWWLCASIGGLSNDLFSFEKEFVRHGSDSNLVLVMLLNDTQLSLCEAIERGIAWVRQDVIELMALMKTLTTCCEGLQRVRPELLDAVRAFLQSVQWCVMTTWVWQVYTRRYKSTGSIFQENRLPG